MTMADAPSPYRSRRGMQQKEARESSGVRSSASSLRSPVNSLVWPSSFIISLLLVTAGGDNRRGSDDSALCRAAKSRSFFPVERLVGQVAGELFDLDVALRFQF